MSTLKSFLSKILKYSFIGGVFVYLVWIVLFPSFVLSPPPHHSKWVGLLRGLTDVLCVLLPKLYPVLYALSTKPIIEKFCAGLIAVLICWGVYKAWDKSFLPSLWMPAFSLPALTFLIWGFIFVMFRAGIKRDLTTFLNLRDLSLIVFLAISAFLIINYAFVRSPWKKESAARFTIMYISLLFFFSSLAYLRILAREGRFSPPLPLSLSFLMGLEFFPWPKSQVVRTYFDFWPFLVLLIFLAFPIFMDDVLREWPSRRAKRGVKPALRYRWKVRRRKGRKIFIEGITIRGVMINKFDAPLPPFSLWAEIKMPKGHEEIDAYVQELERKGEISLEEEDEIFERVVELAEEPKGLVSRKVRVMEVGGLGPKEKRRFEVTIPPPSKVVAPIDLKLKAKRHTKRKVEEGRRDGTTPTTT